MKFYRYSNILSKIDMRFRITKIIVIILLLLECFELYDSTCIPLFIIDIYSIYQYDFMKFYRYSNILSKIDMRFRIT